MNVPRLPPVSGSSRSSSSNEDPYKEFRSLAEEFRKRQALVHNSKHKSPSTCSLNNKDRITTRQQPVSAESSSIGTSTLLTPRDRSNEPQQHDGEIERQRESRPCTVTEQSDSLIRAAAAMYGEDPGIKSSSSRSTPKKKNTQRSSSDGRTPSSRRRNTASRHHGRRETRSAGVLDQEALDGDDSRVDPRVESAMLKVFREDSNPGGCPGVSVSAIRSLYRKRHEREKAAALNEVRRWWKLSSSGMSTAFTEAAAAAALLLTPGDNGGGKANVLRENRCGLNNNRPESDDLSQIGNAARGYRTLGTWADEMNRADGDRVVDGGIIALNDATSINGRSSRYLDRIMPETRVAADNSDDHHHAQSSVFGNLNWREVLLNDSCRESLVRDIKRTLRTGRNVIMRVEEDVSLGGGRCRWGDCQLMLRTLYMQSVQCCADPALPPITREPRDCNGAGGYFLCMTMEPARRYRQPG